MNVPRELIHFLATSDDFFIATHVDPEGDALGSSIALALALREMGKHAVVFNKDSVPEPYRFLPHAAIVTDRIPERINRLLLLDCNSLERAGLEKSSVAFAVVIDHHVTGSGYGDIRWILPEAPATGLMVFNLIRELGVPMSRDMAVNLYTAIGIDTGIFRYSNTTAECLAAASELIALGVDPAFVADRLYNNYSRGRFLLLKKSLDTLELRGPLALTTITESMYRETGTSSKDTENFVNFALQMEGIQVSVLVRQIEPSSWKVSLRSKVGIDISGVAAHFGGGGHRNAAGCILDGDLGSVKKKLLERLSEVRS